MRSRSTEFAPRKTASIAKNKPVLRLCLALMAIALPVLLVLNWLPSVTLLNQAAALTGWGALCLCLSLQTPLRTSAGRVPGLRALWTALALMALAVLWSCVSTGLPMGLALSAWGMLGAAALVLSVGAEVQRQGHGDSAYRAFCWALLIAGILSLAVALVQYFMPALADGRWIAHSNGAGRIGGNLRQPNHLSSLLLWSMVALVWLHDTTIESQAQRPHTAARCTTALLLFGMLLGVVLTVSRTGTVCVLMLTLWAVLDRSLSPFMRRLLWAAPLVYLACWWGASAWAQTSSHAFSGAVQLHKSDPSSSRFGIWHNSWTLLMQHPWSGIGWGEFNLAWTLTPFPGRPTAFFDHTHNLPLHLLVEMGWPLGGLVLALLLWSLVRGSQACMQAAASSCPMVRSAFLMGLMMAVHSMLEYPLWYAYFLLPTVFALGTCLGAGTLAEPPEPTTDHTPLAPKLAWGALVLMLGSAVCVMDYFRVASIFTPPPNAPPLSERILQGQHSWFFAHHADYAAVTTAVHPSEAIDAFGRASHYLLDTRIMMAWAHALQESGDTNRARYLAQRIAEFKNAQSADFFAPCNEPAQTPPPFQCLAPQTVLSFEDFRP
jgi:O-antigen ligase